MRCPVCDFVIIENVKNNLSKCKNCEHIFQTDLMVGVEYNNRYIFDYFEHNSLRQMSLLRAGFVVGVCNTDNKSILDIGYGSGDFLRVMKKNNWDVCGVDVHKMNLGIPEKTEQECLEKEWGIVTFFDSLEHFPDFDWVKRLKAKYVVCSIPATPPWFPLKSVEWKHFKPGEHLHYFCDKSIKKLYNKYSLVNRSNIEDLIRGKSDKCEFNILTYVFKANDIT